MSHRVIIQAGGINRGLERPFQAGGLVGEATIYKVSNAHERPASPDFDDDIAGELINLSVGQAMELQAPIGARALHVGGVGRDAKTAENRRAGGVDAAERCKHQAPSFLGSGIHIEGAFVQELLGDAFRAGGDFAGGSRR